MLTTPRLEYRPAQPYVGIRTLAPMEAFSSVVPQLLDEIFAWLDAQGIAPDGPPFMRYYVIDMAADMDIELGVPVASPVAGNDRIAGGILPAGQYATLIYTGIENGIAGNGVLLAWGAQQGLTWDQWAADHGDAFGARIEFYLTDPDDEPDPARWETEVAIRLADEPAG